MSAELLPPRRRFERQGCKAAYGDGALWALRPTALGERQPAALRSAEQARSCYLRATASSGKAAKQPPATAPCVRFALPLSVSGSQQLYGVLNKRGAVTSAPPLRAARLRSSPRRRRLNVRFAPPLSVSGSGFFGALHERGAVNLRAAAPGVKAAKQPPATVPCGRFAPPLSVSGSSSGSTVRRASPEQLAFRLPPRAAWRDVAFCAPTVSGSFRPVTQLSAQRAESIPTTRRACHPPRRGRSEYPSFLT